MTGAEGADGPGTGGGRGAALARGLLAGVAAGAFVGLLDAARAVSGGREILQPADAPAVVGVYALAFAPLGLVAALLARRCEWPHRMRNLLVVVGAGWFFVVGWAHLAFLPGIRSGLSISFDLATLAVAAALLRSRYRAPGEDLPRDARWAILAVASLGLALGLRFALPARDDGPPPVAAADASGKRPNVLLYLVDTLRADHLSAYGYEKATSPELDAFAADAVRFEDCRAPSSWTKPSVASLLTGSYPSTHACVELRETLVPEAETLAEVFRAAGWRTGAFVDNPMVSSAFGFAQGFEVFDESRPSVLAMGTILGKGLYAAGVVNVEGTLFRSGPLKRRAPALHEAALRFVDAAGGRPWFAYVHAMEPHAPYEPERGDAEAMGFPKGEPYEPAPAHTGLLPFHVPPKPDDAFLRKVVAQYDGEIRGWSRAFGRFVEGLRTRGRLDDTVVVVVADHGEEFQEHGSWAHGHSLHREVVQVPLLVRLPDSLGEGAKAARGRHVGGTATLLDVAPTLLELCGIRRGGGADPSRPGRSLAEHLLPSGGRRVSDHVSPDRAILGEVTQQYAKLRSIRSGRWFFLRAAEPLRTDRRLFDDVGDRAHRRDRMEAEPADARRLEDEMDELFRRLAELALSGRSRDLDPETAGALKRLGYLGGK